MELTYGTQSKVTSCSAISDLKWFIVSCRFLGIPVFLGLFCDIVLVQGELCLALLSTVLALFDISLQRGGKQTTS